MSKRLHLLESFVARGSDGKDYAVRGYEHLVRWDAGAQDSWEPTGQVEYKLADGRHIAVESDGTMSVPTLGLRLERLHVRPGAANDEPADGLVACDVCLREIPLSEAVVPEAAEYVAHFCGRDCYSKWRDQHARESEPR